MTTRSPLALREATLDDAPAATALLRSLGLALPATDEAARAHWARLWDDNPAVALAARLGRKASRGWVLQDGARVVGFFGTIPLAASWGDEPVLMSCASQWGVEKAHRGDVPRLADAYFGQRGADVLLVTSAIAATGRIFALHGGARVPAPEQDGVLYWVTGARGFARAALRRWGAPAPLAAAGATLAAPALLAALALGRRRPAPSAARVEALRLAEVDDRFDELWRAMLAGPRRLRAMRDAASWRWHFAPLDSAGRVLFLLREEAGRPLGAAALVREDAAALGLARWRVVDVLLRDESDTATLEALLRAACDVARGQRCHVVELVGMPPAVRGAARRLCPLERSLPAWPAHYKALRPDLAAALREESAWQLTGFDGDSSLF